MTKAADTWFRGNETHGQVEIRLFCFPYAGGTGSVYRDWASLLPSSVQVITVELPGRGARLKDSAFTSLPALADALADAILTLLDVPFAFFGHSMGAMIAFELTRRLRRLLGCEPKKLFVSGCRAPHILNSDPHMYNLPKDEFLEQLHRLNGTPREILDNEELMEVMIPLIRADFQLIQTYEHHPNPPLQCPIIAYGGLQDREAPCEVLLPWKEHTISRFALHMFPGDHFFLRSSHTLLLEMLALELREIMARSRHQGKMEVGTASGPYQIECVDL